MTTILEYLQDLDRKGYSIIPAEITIQDVLRMVEYAMLPQEDLDALAAMEEDEAAGVDSFLALMSVADNPERVAEAVSLALDEPEFGSAEWFENVSMIDPQTGKEIDA